MVIPTTEREGSCRIVSTLRTPLTAAPPLLNLPKNTRSRVLQRTIKGYHDHPHASGTPGAFGVWCGKPKPHPRGRDIWIWIGYPPGMRQAPLDNSQILQFVCRGLSLTLSGRCLFVNTSMNPTNRTNTYDTNPGWPHRTFEIGYITAMGSFCRNHKRRLWRIHGSPPQNEDRTDPFFPRRP